jgi:hypothetical protein
MPARLVRIATPLPRLAALIGVLACAACPGTLGDRTRFLVEAGGGDDAGGDGGCPDVPTAVFAPTCGISGCHSTTDKSQGLDLQSPNVASRLVGVCARGGGYLVDPVHPAQSVVYLKITTMPPFGVRMPFARPALDDATIACVLAWASQQGDAGLEDAGSCNGAPPPPSGEAGNDAASD